MVVGVACAVATASPWDCDSLTHTAGVSASRRPSHRNIGPYTPSLRHGGTPGCLRTLMTVSSHGKSSSAAGSPRANSRTASHAWAGSGFIDGGPGHDSIDGHRGNDHILGGEGDDTIEGAEDNDWVDGGPGNDSLNANLDHPGDTLNGGPGTDACVADPGDSILQCP